MLTKGGRGVQKSQKCDDVIYEWSLRVVNVWGKRFRLPQLTHERFLIIDHSCKILFWYVPNWASTDLWCLVLYVTYSTTHQRSVEVQFGRYQKNILQEWSVVKNLSCVNCAAWNVFSINSLLSAASGLMLAESVTQFSFLYIKRLKARVALPLASLSPKKVSWKIFRPFPLS